MRAFCYKVWLRGKEQIIDMSATEIFELRRNNLAKVIDQLIDSQQFKMAKRFASILVCLQPILPSY